MPDRPPADTTLDYQERCILQKEILFSLKHASSFSSFFFFASLVVVFTFVLLARAQQKRIIVDRGPMDMGVHENKIKPTKSSLSGVCVVVLLLYLYLYTNTECSMQLG